MTLDIRLLLAGAGPIRPWSGTLRPHLGVVADDPATLTGVADRDVRAQLLRLEDHSRSRRPLVVGRGGGIRMAADPEGMARVIGEYLLPVLYATVLRLAREPAHALQAEQRVGHEHHADVR